MELKNLPNPFIPEKLPINITEILIDENIIKLISKANRSIGMYNGLLYNSPNPNLLISPLIAQEASLSSKMEGTHATLEDILNFDAGLSVNIEKDEMHEVINYREALYYALEKMSTISDLEKNGKLPLTSNLIKNIHKILLNNVRGSSKNPGEFKKFQNYIGSKHKIDFTPLSPELTPEYMYNLETYIHDERIDVLVQTALIHAQFEMIHPFQDGNGRIGRLLIPLLLYYREVLILPTFYMSQYFESDKNLYIKNLSNISKNNDYKSWIEYFLIGIIEQSEKNTEKAKELMEIYSNIKNITSKEITSQFLIPMIDFMFKSPIFKISQLVRNLNMSKDRAYTLTQQLIDLGILSCDDVIRNRTYFVNPILEKIL